MTTPCLRDALKLAVAQAVPGAQIVEADTVHCCSRRSTPIPTPELLLLDLNMPGAQGFNALVQARANFPTVAHRDVISAREDRRIMQRALGTRAAAFVPKSASIDVIVDGDARPCWVATPGCPRRLTTRQRSDATGSAGDRRDRATRHFDAATVSRAVDAVVRFVEQADRGGAGRVEATVKAHVSAVMQKLGVSNRTQAVLLAQRLSLDQT